MAKASNHAPVSSESSRDGGHGRAIRFEGVCKRYGENEVIRNLDLDVHDRELMVLVGPSGCAKSTMLRMVAGLESVSAGAIYLDGQRANTLTPKERNIAMVFQSYALFPNMTVRGNLSFGMRVRGEDTQTVQREVARVAQMLALTPYLDRKPKALSGGQAQRVALGRAMIRKPRVFLFDEPLSNLDADLRVQMRGEISALQRSSATTTIYVTHDQIEAMTLGDRVAVMNEGQIMQVAPPLTLYHDPANLFVASFIGSPKINRLELDEAHAARLLPVAMRRRLPRGCVLGIRPERVSLTENPEAHASGSLVLEGDLVGHEALGHETLAELALRDLPARLVSRVSGDDAAGLELGRRYHATVGYEHILLFDATSQERIVL